MSVVFHLSIMTWWHTAADFADQVEFRKNSASQDFNNIAGTMPLLSTHDLDRSEARLYLSSLRGLAVFPILKVRICRRVVDYLTRRAALLAHHAIKTLTVPNLHHQ